jgi:hypothetical protein
MTSFLGRCENWPKLLKVYDQQFKRGESRFRFERKVSPGHFIGHAPPEAFPRLPANDPRQFILSATGPWR